MPLGPGTSLGSYSVSAKIGEGGMGEVYRARDTKLYRDVALKVLPPAFTDDPDRLARFEREAKVLASLNHPNIGGIHGLEESEGIKALVLEYIEGPTLADRIAQGPIPVDEALPIAKQIAEALEAADEAGVIHRDLKPANIKVKEDGTVKVLDFGLAKALETTPEGDPSQSPTLTAAATQMGVIMGTAAYMSPEQARGKPVDRRADIWAFGAVLFEMLTGRRAFGGSTTSDTLAAVLKEAPDWSALPSDTPSELRRLLRRSLDKDVTHRLAHISDARLEIHDAQRAPESATSAESTSRARRSVPTWTAATAVIVSLLLGTLFFVNGFGRSDDRGTSPVTRFTTRIEGRLNWESNAVVLSPDGRRLVYAFDGRLYLRELDALEASPIPGTEGAIAGFFSPDGEWVGFSTQSDLRKVSVPDGTVVKIADASLVHKARWESDDRIYYGLSGATGLFSVSATGGTPQLLVELTEDFGDLDWPQVLPGGEWLIFSVLTSTSPSWNDAQIVAQSLSTGERRVLVDGGFAARYLDSGHLVYMRGGSLLAAPFDLSTLQSLGPAETVVQGIRARSVTGSAHFAISDSGTLSYLAGEDLGLAERSSLVWVDRAGQETATSSPPKVQWDVRVSPDGALAVGTVLEPEGFDIWLYDLQGERGTNLTGDTIANIAPVWMPDGDHVVFSATAEGERVLVSRSLAGGAGARLSQPETIVWAQGASADGRFVIVEHTSETRDLSLVDVESGAMEPWLHTDANERNADLSPDGEWVAFESDRSGTSEIYVAPFAGGEAGMQRVSTNGGVMPLWGPNGREVFYRRLEPDEMVAVDFDPTASVRFGNPTSLFPTDDYAFIAPGGRRSFDLAPDGERFLMMRPMPESDSPNDVVLVENWFEELNRLVPVN